ncbi:MAG: hypothetical protein ABFS86_02840 [Planctomycetota bacterium]
MHRPGISLEDGSKVAVIGGGPAASFFAITLLREAGRRGFRPDVRIFERRSGMTAPDGQLRLPTSGCNYCAGGISPRMSDVLDELGIEIPPEIVQDRVRTITVQSHWKNLELGVPEDRRMYSVYRGSRPVARSFRLLSFDAVLLGAAAKAGARVVNGTVVGLERSDRERPVVRFRQPSGDSGESFEADFVAFAGGVNQTPGGRLDRTGLIGDLGRMIPGFAPPAVRRTLIFELELSEEFAGSMTGDLTFILFGSRDLRLEMGSLMPKGRFVTVVLIGPDIDRGVPSRSAGRIVSTFLSLPHIRRILPPHLVKRTVSCVCRPSMVVGCAAAPVGERIGIVGDMVTSRLYKDGIYTAYLTGSGLAHAALAGGIDRRGLGAGYLPLIRRLEADLRSGRNVFLMMSLAFRNPFLSRMTYQAILRERRMLPKSRRRLEAILWRVASGDDTYSRIFRAMLHPQALLSFLVRGALVTVRNWLTECLFGLRWTGLGRFPTGVPREDLAEKTRDLRKRLGDGIGRFHDFGRMYTIRIRAPARRIVGVLGQMGDREKEFLRPRFVDVRRVEGEANAPGSVIEYSIWLKALSFRMSLERFDPDRGLIYRVRDGFARGGVLVLDIDQRRSGRGRSRDCRLSVLVAFDFARGTGVLKRAVWALYRRLFPSFVHDVVWNHALCRIKDVVEKKERRRHLPPGNPGGPGPQR